MSAGIGLKVERSAAGYVVTELRERGAAKRSGLLEIGDLVASIDGKPSTLNLKP
jgi:C-terminal processing protease CtpA/Prc